MGEINDPREVRPGELGRRADGVTAPGDELRILRNGLSAGSGCVTKVVTGQGRARRVIRSRARRSKQNNVPGVAGFQCGLEGPSPLITRNLIRREPITIKESR